MAGRRIRPRIAGQESAPPSPDATGSGDALAAPMPGGLGDAFVEAVTNDFKAHGAKAIATMREDKPELYLKIVLGILPKELTDAAKSGVELVVVERRIVHDPD